MTCWSSSQTQFLQNFRSGIWPHFVSSVTDSFMWFWIVSLYKSIHFDEVPHGSILAPKLFQLYIDDLLGYFICNIAFYAADTTL